MRKGAENGRKYCETHIDDRLTAEGALGREEGEVTLGAVGRAIVLVEELLHHVLSAVRTVEVLRMPDSSQCRYHLVIRKISRMNQIPFFNPSTNQPDVTNPHRLTSWASPKAVD